MNEASRIESFTKMTLKDTMLTMYSVKKKYEEARASAVLVGIYLRPYDKLLEEAKNELKTTLKGE